MSQICLYFHIHQPYRLKDLNIFDIGHSKGQSYFSEKNSDDNEKIFKKVAQKSYFPMLSLLYKLVKRYPEFKFAISIPGTFIEQSIQYQPSVLRLLQKIHNTGQLEIIAETYYHSLAFLYSKKEFHFQIRKHLRAINKYFGVKPTVFRNTELIYSDGIADMIDKFKFKGILTEAVDRYLNGQRRTQVFVSNTKNQIPLLLKHAKLSDDIAFRFSNRGWEMYPLIAEKYMSWINSYGNYDYVNLFMDFETFGEHHWHDTGIFEFFEKFVDMFIVQRENRFVTPGEVFDYYDQEKWAAPTYKVPQYISWADIDRSITAWRDNVFQFDTLEKVYQMRDRIIKSRNQSIIEDWRRLQSSDHFYYMCTKWSADGDVHSYFSPYNTPLEAYRRYCILLADLEERLMI